VYKCLDTESGQFVAIKQVDTSKMNEDQLASVHMEINLLKKLDHPNLVKYIGTCLLRCCHYQKVPQHHTRFRRMRLFGQHYQKIRAFSREGGHDLY